MRRGGPGRKRPEAQQEVAVAVCRVASPGAGMVNFCPQCGQKVEAKFNFCPSCGGRLPIQEGEPMQISPAPSVKELSQERQDELQSSVAQKRVKICLPDKEIPSVSVKQDPVQNRVATISPKEKAKFSSRSPKKDKSASVRPLPEGQILIDLNNKKWKLVKLVSQNDCGLLYEAKSASEACSQQRYSLKLDSKDGKLFNEQNFLQRAAKKATVEKWKRQHSVPLLGLPTCIGFGLHGDNYRFLVFPDLGRSLQSILDDSSNKMTEKAALQITVRLLDALEYLHENEYVHGDVAAENIYVNPADLSEVTLAVYCFAFRYCPGGRHVSHHEGSKTPHEGTLEFISLDSHKGAAPSRRSDLESLGYCLVKWLYGVLPWSEDQTDPCTVMQKKERYKTDMVKHLRGSFGRGVIPDALNSYLVKVMSLEYEEKPNYDELRALLNRPLELMRTSAYDSVDLKGTDLLEPLFRSQGCLSVHMFGLLLSSNHDNGSWESRDTFISVFNMIQA